MNTERNFYFENEMTSNTPKITTNSIKYPKTSEKGSNNSIKYSDSVSNIIPTNKTSNIPNNINTVQEKIFENLSESQKAADLGVLIDSEEFSKVLKQNPWQIDVKTTLEKIQKRLYSNSEIQLRIGGRVLYSTSRLVNVKSTCILQDSRQTQDFLEEEEVYEDEFQDQDESFDENDPYAQRKINLNSILGKASPTQVNGNIEDLVADEKLKQYLHERNQILAQTTSINRFFNQDRDGNRYLASPLRKVYRKVDFSELGNALVKTFKYQIRKPSKHIGLKEIGDKSKKRFPSSLLKKAEEKRALMEEQIFGLYRQIKEKFQPDNPVPFLSIIISPTPEGIVQTVLYLLQLVNRKKIEIWQEIPSEKANEQLDNKSEALSLVDDSGINIFISPC